MKNQIFIAICILHLLAYHQTSAGVSVEDFFPFGESVGDAFVQRVDDDYAGPVSLTQGFPFFNDTYHHLWVSTNGALSFRKGIDAYTPVCGAFPQDSTMIAPFWADVDITNGGNISYRQSNDPNLLVKATNEVYKGFPDLGPVSLQWLFISTWDHVSFFGECNNGQITNTFQIILGTDGVHSFTIFYYEDILWTTGTASNGNCTDGSGGQPAKAGFDVGDGVTFHEIQGSCTPDVVTVDDRSNVGEAGKWVFRVETNFVPAPEPETTTVHDSCGGGPGSEAGRYCASHGDLYPDRWDCGQYYHCSWEVAHHKSCPQGLHFNNHLKVCDWPGNAGCIPSCP